jgi:hypothetical protein
MDALLRASGPCRRKIPFIRRFSPRSLSASLRVASGIFAVRIGFPAELSLPRKK